MKTEKITLDFPLNEILKAKDSEKMKKAVSELDFLLKDIEGDVCIGECPRMFIMHVTSAAYDWVGAPDNGKILFETEGDKWGCFLEIGRDVSGKTLYVTRDVDDFSHWFITIK